MASLNDFELAAIDDDGNVLAPLAGKAVLIVNVASKCGYTPQYAELEALNRELADQGFAVLGVPCNQFGGQEPGTETQILEFCQTRYDVSFPMSRKVDVNGADRHPLYEWLTAPANGFPGDIGWNFEKFLVNSDGAVAGRYPSGVSPRDNGLLQDIAAALPD